MIPNLAKQLIHLAEFLGRDRVYISIFENGSGDGSPAQLDILRDSLNTLGIGNSIISEPGPPVSLSFFLTIF
jgi:hypothetical protein